MNSSRSITLFVIVLTSAGMLPFVAASEETEWGHLKGRFTYDGDPPKPKSHSISKDVAEFGHAIDDESLLVNEENGGIANILIYLLPRDSEPLAIHPSYAPTEKSKVELTMKDGRFEPHILLLRTTQTMLQRNRDSVGHNAKIDFLHNTPM